jgi:hypothetical protein
LAGGQLLQKKIKFRATDPSKYEEQEQKHHNFPSQVQSHVVVVPNSVDMRGCVYAPTFSHSDYEPFAGAAQAWPGLAHHLHQTLYHGSQIRTRLSGGVVS